MRKSFAIMIILLLLASLLIWGCSSGSDSDPHIDPQARLAVHISSPENNAIIAHGRQIQFEGSCVDKDSKELSGESLEWTADADGRLGTGATITTEEMSTGAQNVTLTCTNADGDVETASVQITVYATQATGKLPDTGQVVSHTETQGEDTDYTIHPPGYVKLDAQGEVLAADAPEWVMVRDAVTGLIWEVKTDDDSIHDKDNEYSWQDAQAIVEQLNDQKFGGYDDWRLPTAKELSCLIQAVDKKPMSHEDYFPNTLNDEYWSSTTNEEIKSVNAWSVHFKGGTVNKRQMRLKKYVRAVRGESKKIELADNGDGTVTDLTTGLMWQQIDDSGEMDWEEALAYCENLKLAGYDDWRMPNRNELLSVANHRTSDPAIDTKYFPATVSFFYWSSTTVSQPGSAFSVNFFSGNMTNLGKTHTHRIRAVRGGTPKTSLPSFAPAVKITGPERNATFAAGDQIQLEGSCTDSKGDNLTGASLAWVSNVDGQIGTDANSTTANLNTGEHLITLSCTDAEGAEGKASVPIIVYATETTGILPDTGQNISYTDSAGEDSDYTFHTPGYVKLDGEGNVLAANAPDWTMVMDAVTGLIWEVKTNTDTEDIYYRDNVYSWQAAQERINRMNEEAFGGYTDWRMPTVTELSGLIQGDAIAPLINRDYFPNNSTLPLKQEYWSATTDHETNSVNAWWVHFSIGDTGKAAMRVEQSVRAVRGETKSTVWVDNGDKTITDTTTGLMWQQISEAGELTWEEALAYCENLDLAGHDDWRLPNRNELLSIVDHGAIDPAIDANFFPETSTAPHWSATTRKRSKDSAYSVEFFKGEINSDPKQNKQQVRAVRGGK